MTGCTKVSPGCAHCYAETITLRFKRGPVFLPGKTIIQVHEDRVTIPLRWRDPRCIFTCSMSDLFHEEVPDWFIRRAFMTMAVTPHHIYQVLTKRPERMVAVLAESEFTESLQKLDIPWPLPNVWLGVSVENQVFADRRIPVLLEQPALVHFLSVEPLLKKVTLSYEWMTGRMRPLSMSGAYTGHPPGRIIGAGARVSRVDWVIVGGESGPRHRPMDADWVRLLRDQCVGFEVPFFLKQWGGARPGGEALLDGRPWHEWPALPDRYGKDDRP